jgi:DNA-binding response OmpR family regulator
MLTGHSERSRVIEAMRLGVNEYLLKPVSSVALLARIVSILSKPRKMLKQGDYYGPEPRSKAAYRPDADPGFPQIFLVN